MKTIQSFVSVSVKRIQALSELDILSMIPRDVLAEIKAKDPHPYFQAYSLCHEGISTPRIIGDSEKPIHWLRAAVQSFKNLVNKGVKFFLGHNKDNSTENRETLGEIVAETQKEIDGNLNHIVIGYFPDKEKVKDLDVCSQEAVWDIAERGMNYFAEKIHELTGIALANSKEETPAFKNSKRLAIMQAFEDNKDQNTGGNKMDLKQASFGELLDEVKQRKPKPSEIFDLSDIKNDKSFSTVFSEMEQIKNDLNDAKEKIQTLETEKTEIGNTLAAKTAKERLEKKLADPESPVTDKQKSFILKRAEQLKDTTDEGIAKHVQDSLAIFKEAAEVLDVKEDLDLGLNNPDGAGKGDTTDPTTAAGNEFLDEDLEY